MAKKRMIHAINDALTEEMARDNRLILFGEDVAISLFGDTKGLQKKFGAHRVRNTPISESVISSMAVGAAAAGYRVIAHMMFGNFLYTGFDAIANQAAKLRFMTGGQVNLPITYLAVYGGGKSAAAQHSDTIYPLLMNLGGLNVVVPSSPADAKGLLKSAIRGNNPTFFLQAGGRGGEFGEVPDGDYAIPLGEAAVRRSGKDLTVVAIGAMVRVALEAAELLQQEGIDIEVIDPRSLVPLDSESIYASIRKTGRLIVIDESRDRCSAASHIAAIVADGCFRHLRAPIRRLTVPDVAMPYSPVLEKAVMPNGERLVTLVKETIDYAARQ